MLRRLALTLVSAILVACATASKPLEEVLPATLEGWTRIATAPVDTASAPDLVKQLGLKRAVSATYKGPTQVDVRVYEMNVATSAFELIQKWRQQDGLAVYNGPYFVVASSGPQPETSHLLEALRKRLQ